MSRRVSLYIAATFVLAILGQTLTANGAALFHDVPWTGLVVLSTLIALSERFSTDIGGKSRTSVAAAILLAVNFLYGAPGNLVATFVCAIAGMIEFRSAWYKVVFNFSNMLLATAGASATVQLLVAVVDLEPEFSQLLLPAALAGLVFYALNLGILCGVRGLAEKRSWVSIFHEAPGLLAVHYAALGVVGLLVAFVYQTLGWVSIIGLAVPVGMMELSMRQYVSRTTTLVSDLRRTNDQLTESHEAIPRALSPALDTRDEETEGHSKRVARYAEMIGLQYGLSREELTSLHEGVELHDIGKIGIPDAVLLKRGPLTEEEWVLVRRHPEIGYSMIAHIPFLQRASEVVLHHHERFDGTGYPHGLAGHAIPLNARIFAIADTIDAMRSDRPYRTGVPLDTALAEIKRSSGTQFDPSIVRSLLSIDQVKLEAIRRLDDVPSAAPLPGSAITSRS